MRTATRRQVLKAGGAIAGLQVLAPIAFRAGDAWGATGPDPATANRLRLIVLDLGGGNDGLSTVVPQTGVIRDVYDKVRVATNISAGSLLPLGATNGGTVGLNPKLPTVYSLWQANRVAIVQGVDYPAHNYSHFVSDDIWQSGEPGQAPDSGWLGRHLDRTGIGTAELRGIGIGFDRLPLALQGTNLRGEEINSLSQTQFLDGGQTGVAGIRHQKYAGYDAAPASDALPHYYGARCRDALNLATAASGLTAATPGGISNALLTARTLLSNNLGVEVVIIRTAGYDTHVGQLGAHQALMTDLDRGIEAFYYGTRSGTPILSGTTPIGALDANVAARTLIMTYSEFGRRIGDNGDGTDHGAAAPQLLIGPPPPVARSGAVTLVPGLHRDHPNMGTYLAPADNLAMTTDLRTVYQAVITNWIADPTGTSAGTNPDTGDPHFSGVSGSGVNGDGSLAGLFGTA
jgi:uncharacterized protein (DUF1501 family)